MISVNELKELCEKQIAKGNGDKKVLISRDDEGNGFHGLFYEFTDNADDIAYYDKQGMIDNIGGISLDKVVLLG